MQDLLNIAYVFHLIKYYNCFVIDISNSDENELDYSLFDSNIYRICKSVSTHHLALLGSRLKSSSIIR